MQRRCLWLMVAACFSIGAAMVRAAPLTTLAEAEFWLQHYYQQPEPERFVELVPVLGAHGQFEGAQRVPLQVFLGSLMAQHPTRWSQWISALADQPEPVQQALQQGLWRADTEASRQWLAEFAQGEYDIAPPKVDGQPVQTSLQLQMVWHRFYATGNWQLVRQVVAILEPAHANLEGVAVQDAELSEALRQQQAERLSNLALWSLQLHAAEHPVVLEVIGQMYQKGELSVRQQAALVPLLESLAPGQYVEVDDIET